MGCGSSSLKGDPVPNPLVSEPADRPARKINTDFGNVNYGQDAQNRRMTEYAPHETNKTSKRVSKEGRNPLPESPTATTSQAGTNLQPYHTHDDGTRDINDIALENMQKQYPHEGKTGQQGEAANQSSDPAKFSNNANMLSPSDATGGPNGTQVEDKKERKKSWLGQKFSEYQDKKTGRGAGYTDEELERATGMNREQFADFSKNADKVGSRQDASTGRVAGAVAAPTL